MKSLALDTNALIRFLERGEDFYEYRPPVETKALMKEFRALEAEPEGDVPCG